MCQAIASSNNDSSYHLLCTLPPCYRYRKHKTKIAKRFSGAQNHKLPLLTELQNIPKVQYCV